MNLKEADDAHKDYTKLASDLARQLAFAGLAIVWIFKVDGPDGAIQIPTALLYAGFFLAVYLLADYTQYAYAGTVWGIYHRRKELELKHDQTKDFKAPKSLNYVTNGAWYVKMVAVFIAYAVILFFFLGALWQRAKGSESKPSDQAPPAATSNVTNVPKTVPQGDEPNVHPAPTSTTEPKAEPPVPKVKPPKLDTPKISEPQIEPPKSDSAPIPAATPAVGSK